MIGKYSLAPGELKAVTKSNTICLIMTANGTDEINEKATVYIKDLDIFCGERISFLCTLQVVLTSFLRIHQLVLDALV